MSEDGSRIFLTSPDPDVGDPDGVGPLTDDRTTCGAGTLAASSCPPQLFVRQYSSGGVPSVRWISRPQIAGQAIGLLGPTGFEGASGDGQVVFFRTNTPLTAGDPNGAGPPPGGGHTTGTASNSSWDLYRYELPGDRNTDPAGGQLTRISGGPDSDLDPNVHTGTSDAGVVRYLSEDGQRAYFVTRGILGDPGDSWNQPPSGGATAPSGTPGTATTRNLYLYDDSRTGDERWQFIAQLPTDGHKSNSCSALLSSDGCLRGTPDGRAIVFETAGQLAAGDDDEFGDIYLYDAEADELVRVSSPPDETFGYPCSSIGLEDECNGDLGFATRAHSEVMGLQGRQHANLAIRESAGSELLSVFFESRAPLVPEDQDGGRMDVYEWQGGALSLVLPGNGDHEAFYSGNSLDGEDVFLLTTQRIDPREIDEDYDVYDARIGGGFPLEPEASSCDVHADACQGAGQGTLGGSVGTGGGAEGGAKPPARAGLTVRFPSKAARRRAARTGVLPLSVRVSKARRVKATARASLGRRLRPAGSGSVLPRRAGRAVVRIHLNRAMRARLRGGGPIRLTVSVRMAGALTRSLDVTLRGAGR